MSPAGPAGAAAGDSGTSASAAVLDAVILVDESASLTTADLNQEKAAVETIAQGQLSPDSRITVVGFGSSVNQDSATDIVCQSTQVDTPAHRDYLATCPEKLKIRTAAEGHDTDHVAALQQALSTLQSGGPAGALRTVFVLTDGNLDVHNDPGYGTVEADRNPAALRILKQELGQARTLKTQIWPLGFGDVNQSFLDLMAAGGDTTACGSDATRPRARKVNSSADVTKSLVEALASRSCSIVDGPSTGSTVKVTVPAIATDGTIIVRKPSASVEVHYYDPSGAEVPSQGSRNGSTFSRSGQNETTESLRITNPVSGTWTIKAKSAGGSNQSVTVYALWQGAVRAVVLPNPPTARPGQPVTVQVDLSTRNGPLATSSDLRGVAVSLSATGQSGWPTQVTMRDDGVAPDPRAGDGEFTGRLTAPQQTGPVDLKASVIGPGIYATQLPKTLSVQAVDQIVQSEISLDVPEKLVVGTRLTGTISTSNGTSSPVPATLGLPGADGLVTLNPTTFTLPSGNSTQSFTITVGHRTGHLDATVALVRTQDQSAIGQASLRAAVVQPPSWFWRHRWPLLVALLVVLALLGWLLARYLARRRAADVSGLIVDLMNPDGTKAASLPPLSRATQPPLRFYLLRPDAEHPVDPIRLSRMDNGRGRWFEARRAANSRVEITSQEDGDFTVQVGGPGEMLIAAAPLVMQFRERPGKASGPVVREATATDQSDVWGSSASTVPLAQGFPSASTTIRPTTPTTPSTPTKPTTPAAPTTPTMPATNGARTDAPPVSSSTDWADDDPWA